MYSTFTLRKSDYLLTFLVTCCLIFFVVGAKNIACAAHDSSSSCDNGMDVRGGDGGSTDGGGGIVSRPPLPCTVTLDRTLVASGTPSVLLSWAPVPSGRVTLRRGRDRITVPDNATTFSDSIASLKSGRYTYSLSYSALRPPRPSKIGSVVTEQVANVLSATEHIASHGGTGKDSDAGGDHSGGGGAGGAGGDDDSGGDKAYACSVTLTVVDKIVECNDTIDNGDTEDAFTDTRDPGCHSDGNPNNSRSYVSLDTNETNVPADLKPFITSVTRIGARRPIRVTAGADNLAPIYAANNSLVYGWRNTGGGAMDCGRRGRSCFTAAGKTYLRLNTFTRAYNGLQRRTDDVRSFRPLDIGRYEVCAVADFTNVIFEGVTGESNNSTCKLIEVDDDVDVTDFTGPPTISATPNRVKRDSTVTISWDTGGRTDCTITGTNGDVIDVSGTVSTGSEESIAITSETKYVLACADDDSRVETKISLIPRIQEL